MTAIKQDIGIVLSASRMTDMPKFYPKELIEEVENRRNKGMLVHTLVMWTKHPQSRKIIVSLDRINRRIGDIECIFVLDFLKELWKQITQFDAKSF